MAIELRPGLPTKIMAAVVAEGTKKSRRSTGLMATACVAQAKVNVSSGSHTYDTPTPASEGSGPAVISGTLRRCITRTPVVASFGGFESMVGPAPGFFTPYGIPLRHYVANPRPRADSAKYGYYLETGDWGHVYPWLGPALHMVEIAAGPVILREVFAAGWPEFG